jgi:hypothetical protein
MVAPITFLHTVVTCQTVTNPVPKSQTPEYQFTFSILISRFQIPT